MSAPGEAPSPILDRAVLSDMQALLGRETLARIVGIQLGQARHLIEALRGAPAEPDPRALYPLVHQIAGSAATLGLSQLSDYALGLEIAIQAGPIPDLGSRIKALAEASAAAHGALSAAFPELGETRA